MKIKLNVVIRNKLKANINSLQMQQNQNFVLKITIKPVTLQPE